MIPDRVPPQNIEAEQDLLSGCLFSDDIATECIDLLLPEDFYRPSHQKIFSGVIELKRSQSPVDLTTVTSWLRKSGDLESVGGSAYLTQIVQECPIPASVEHYAAIIKDAANLRRVISICNRMAMECFESRDNASSIIGSLQASALQLGEQSSTGAVHVKNLSQQSYERYEAWRTDKGPKVLKTGYHNIDAVSGGFIGPKLIILAARPGIGKTAFMCNMVEKMASEGISIGVFSMEMDKTEIDDRWYSSMTGINSVKLTSKTDLSEDEWKKINLACIRKMKWNVWVDDTGSLKINELCRRIRKMVHMGVEIVFIDQLSFISGNSKLSTFDRNTENVEALARLKKELRIPIVLLAQINRKSDESLSKEPQLSHLKNTGALEESADMVFLGFRRFPYTKEQKDENHAQWVLAKNRGGPTAKFEMFWIPKQSKFENLDWSDSHAGF